ncbi:hypothetical protein BMF35_a0652 [Aurantiacibacter gangjinensis]|nr:hypothetical protein BMF35_a0652 [Aurantiacibacter gangjinensis]
MRSNRPRIQGAMEAMARIYVMLSHLARMGSAPHPNSCDAAQSTACDLSSSGPNRSA